MLHTSFNSHFEEKRHAAARPLPTCEKGCRNLLLLSTALVAVTANFFSAGGALADVRFENRSETLPVEHVYGGGWDHFVGGGVAVLDCNGDSKPDLVAAGGTNPASLLLNQSTAGGPLTFVSAPFPAMPGMTGAYPLDIDSDGHMDLVVLRNGPNVLLRGTGDCRFEDATEAWGFDAGHSWSTAFTATWESAEQFPTLVVGNYVDASDPEGPFGACDKNRLFRPDGDGYAAPSVLEPAFCPLSMLISDWRRDGAPMLRISNDRHYYLNDGREQMWHLSPLQELGEADGWDALKLWGMGIASRDLTGDGLPEVMLTSMGDQILMTNDGEGFTTVAWETGSFAHRPFTGGDGRPSTGWHAEFADVDNDGLSDLFIAKGNVDQMPGMAMADPNNLLMQQSDGTFVETAEIAGIATTDRSRGAAVVDLNADGLLDLVVVNRRAPLEVWQNATASAGNWLAVDVAQNGVNRNAVGAFVEVRAAGRIQTRELTVGGGHVSGAQVPAHFGLGPAAQADVRVIWPDGTASDWTTLSSGTTHWIAR